MLILACFLSLCGAIVAETLDCSTFNRTEIKLVTFDVFAALMDVYTSLETSVSFTLPFLRRGQVKSLVREWVGHYGSFQGKRFSKQMTGGAEPFVWMSNTSLALVLEKFDLTDRVPLNSAVYNNVLRAWGDEIPWKGTTATLNAVSKQYQVAPLSNGDSATLLRAMTVFTDFTPAYIFSSNFPVGAFKPNKRMYEQLLTTSGLQAKQILHVAGARTDGQGAREAGLYSALTWHQPLPGLQPCFLLPNITDLLPILL